MEKLKLEMDLVPKSQWYKSLSSIIKKSEWDKIRKSIIEKQKLKCAICGASGILFCYEKWEYVDKTHVQKLIGLEAICHACNAVKHFGKTEALAMEGKIDIDGVVRHFLEINSGDMRSFEDHKKTSFDLWKKRSKQKWKIDYGIYSSLSK